MLERTTSRWRRRARRPLQIAVVGPTHPSRGAVAAHTTTLAHHLADAGHDVTLVSWAHRFPSGRHRAEPAPPAGSMEVAPFPRTIRALSWARPDSWVRVGRRLRGADAVIVVHALPAVVAGPPRPPAGGRGPARLAAV